MWKVLATIITLGIITGASYYFKSQQISLGDQGIWVMLALIWQQLAIKQ